MICIDTNIWIYLFDSGLPEHEKVRPVMERALRNEDIFTNTVIQLEIMHYLSRQIADSHVESFLDLEGVTTAGVSHEEVHHATKLLKDYGQVGIGGRDACILASMERNNVSELWTHDTALKQMSEELSWLTTYDPVTG